MELIDQFPAGKEWTGEEALAVAQTVRRWADRELIARRQTLREDYDGLLLPAYTTLMLELGLQRYVWDEQDRAQMAVTLTLAQEQVARGDVGLAWLLAGLLAPSAAVAPDDALEPLLAGGPERAQICALVLPAFALEGADQQARFEGRRLQGRARQDGETWFVDGAATRPLAAGATATLFGVLCQVEGEEDPALLLVPDDADGVRRGEPIVQTGLAAARNALVTFEGARAAAVVDTGPGACHRLLTWHHLLAAAACSGALLAAHEILADWGDNRVIKGKGQVFKDNPLCASLMADLAQRIGLIRALVLDLARRVGRPDLYGDAGEAPLRCHALTVAHHVAASAEEGLNHVMELMGSAGYATEWNLERYWRDVKTVQVHLGAVDLARIAVARHHYGSRAI